MFPICKCLASRQLDQMSIHQALDLFYQNNGFAPIQAEQELCTGHVYHGYLFAPLPNIAVRPKYLKYDDLHHILTGYRVGRSEGEVSACALGTDSMLNHPILGIMN